MRFLRFFLAILVFSSAAFAGEIREFDIKTIERLGNELTEVGQQPERGATNPIRKRVRETAKAALRGRLFKINYDYIVLDDPDGSGFLVYALGQGPKRGDVVIHGHFRVTVSTDGLKAERVDALSHTLLIQNRDKNPSPKGYHREFFATSQAVGTKPVETLVYASNMMKLQFEVATPPGQAWRIRNGNITKGERIR